MVSECKTAVFGWHRIEVLAPDACWRWNGSINRWGYGDCQWNGKRVNASRAAYESVNGKVPEGLVVCHSCDNPACCNPAHLFAATQAVNVKDCKDKGRWRSRSGATHPRPARKMTDEQVREARQLYLGGKTQTEIARRWGLHSSVISRAVRGESWSHLE